MRRRLSHSISPPWAAFAVAALAAGCGGGGSASPSTTTTTGPPTKADFLISADQICHSFESQIEAAGDDVFTGKQQPSPSQVRRFALKIAAPKLQDEIDAVRSLGAPKGDEQQVEGILKASEEGVEEIRQDPELIRGGNAPPGLKEAGRLAKAYGSRECGAQ